MPWPRAVGAANASAPPRQKAMNHKRHSARTQTRSTRAPPQGRAGREGQLRVLEKPQGEDARNGCQPERPTDTHACKRDDALRWHHLCARRAEALASPRWTHQPPSEVGGELVWQPPARQRVTHRRANRRCAGQDVTATSGLRTYKETGPSELPCAKESPPLAHPVRTNPALDVHAHTNTHRHTWTRRSAPSQSFGVEKRERGPLGSGPRVNLLSSCCGCELAAKRNAARICAERPAHEARCVPSQRSRTRSPPGWRGLGCRGARESPSHCSSMLVRMHEHDHTLGRSARRGVP